MAGSDNRGRKPGQGFPVTDRERLAAWGREGGLETQRGLRRRYGKRYKDYIERVVRSKRGKVEKKIQSCLRLTGQCKRLLKLLADKHGVTQTAIVEIAVREKAERDGVRDTDADSP